MGSGVKLFGRYRDQQVVVLVSNQDAVELPEPGSIVDLSFDERSVIRF
jgi:hypothetical protein